MKLIMQRDNDNTLADALVASFERNPKKVYIFTGALRETGFKRIEEELIDRKLKLFLAIGIDKKNTTRGMLETMLEYTKDVFVYSNNQTREFDANMCIFEYSDNATVYTMSSNLSDSGMVENISLYTEIVYDLKDENEKKEYKNSIKDLVKIVEQEKFTRLNKEEIQRLVNEKEIFTTRQYNHTVKSISELLGNHKVEEKSEITKQEIDDDVFVSDISIPKIDLSDMSIDLDDIDFSGVEETSILPEKKVEEKNTNEKKKKEVKEEKYDVDISQVKETKIGKEALEELSQMEEMDTENELYDEELKDLEFDEDKTLDIADLLFSKAKVKLDMYNIKEEEEKEKQEEAQKLEEDILEEDKDEELVQVKKVNLNHITNLIFETVAKASKGQDISNIKVPNHIRLLIPDFFELNENAKSIERDGVVYKERMIKLEIVDAKTGEKFTDRNAKIVFKNGQSYLTFSSEVIKNIKYNEKDIIRIIKLSSDIYHIEIISQEMQEYKLWSKVCNQKLKASDRKFGMM